MNTERAYIYAIENKTNGNKYIGSSVRPEKRFAEHRCLLNKGSHHSFVLQKAWDKYGEQAFEFKVIVVCAKAQRYMYEQLAMNLQSYNILRTVREHEVRGGWHHTDEFKAKLSRLNKGKKLSEEHKAKVRVAHIGKKRDQAFREKARQRQLGVSPSELTRHRLSEANKLRYVDITAKITADVNVIYNNYKHKDNIKQLCQQYGISTTTFYTYCKKLNLVPIKQKVMDELCQQIDGYIKSGMSLRAAAIKVNMNPVVARKALRFRGMI